MGRRTTVAVVGALLILTGALFAQSAAQRNRSRPFGPGRCGPADPVYLKGARETGGQPFFLSPSEVGSSAHIMSETSASDSTRILWATDGNGARDFSLPVDGTIKRLTISASFDGTGGQLTIVSPDGNPVSGDGRIQDTVLSCVRIVTVPEPRAGLWRVTTAPSERFWLVAHARSDVDIESAEFVRSGGRPGHEGLMKISGRPVASGAATLRVRVAAENVRTIEFMSMSMEGRLLQRLDLTRTDDEEFVGTLDLPEEAFRLVMTGLDAAGQPYQRVYAAAFRGELVEVSPADGIDSLVPGQPTALRYRIRNLGPRAQFHSVATKNAEVLRVVPATVELDEGAEATITVSVLAPADAAPGTSVDVMVTTSSSDARETMNYVMRHLKVTKE